MYAKAALGAAGKNNLAAAEAEAAFAQVGRWLLLAAVAAATKVG